MSGWSANLLAARAVALHARDTAEARELLDMLGLIEDGRVVVDRPFAVQVPTLGDTTGGRSTPTDSVEPRAKNVTTPPGLRILPPLEKQPREKAPPKDRKPRMRASRAVPGKRTRRLVAECGTTSGHARHVRLKEPTCEPCRKAKADYMRENYDRTTRRPPRPEPKCGTRGGYDAHLRKQEPTCQPCRDANAAAQRDRYLRKATENGYSVNIRGPRKQAS